MERTLFISKIENLKYYTPEYKRVYFGNEFCERLIPNKAQLKKVLDFTKEKKIRFTFVTPYVTDEGINKLKTLFSYLSKIDKGIEVIVNSYGVLNIVNQFGLIPVLGRLLVKQKKGPRILNLTKNLPSPALRRFKQTNITSIVEKFLKQNNVKRIELDNALQGIDISLKELKASIYYPYVYVTTSRFCMTNLCEKSNQRGMLGIFPCKKECQKYAFELRNKHMPKTLILKGNTQFFKNDTLPEDLKEKNIDRLVYQPEIPV